MNTWCNITSIYSLTNKDGCNDAGCDRGEHGVGGRRDEDGGIGCCGCGWLTTYKFHFAGRRQLIDDSIRPWRLRSKCRWDLYDVGVDILVGKLFLVK